MGLHTRSPRQNNFLSVKHNSICREWKPNPDIPNEQPPEGFQEITVKNPSEKGPNGEDVYVQKWVQKFGSLDGTIVGAQWYDTKDKYKFRSMGVKLKIKDEWETFILDLAYGTRPYDAFTKMMENIDYSFPVEFSVWHDTKNDKTAFVIRQDGNTVKWRYTRDYVANTLDALQLAGEASLYRELDEATKVEGNTITVDLANRLTEKGYPMAPGPVKDDFGKWSFDNQKAWLYKRLLGVVIPKIEELYPPYDEKEPEYSGPEEQATAAAAGAESPVGESRPDGPAPPYDDPDIPF